MYCNSKEIKKKNIISHPDVNAGCWIWRAAYVPAVDVHRQLKGWHPLRVREGAEQCHLLISTDPIHTGPGPLLQLLLFQLHTWTSGFSLKEGLRGNRWDNNSILMDSLRWGDTGTGMDWIGLDRSGLIRVRKHWSVTSWSCQCKKMSICFNFLFLFPFFVFSLSFRDWVSEVRKNIVNLFPCRK